jgi:hypothetical protein
MTGRRSARFFAGALCLLAVSAAGQAGCSKTQEAKASPVSSSEPAANPDEYDFGVIWLDAGPQVLYHTFTVRNDREEAIEIKHVKKTCACVHAELGTMELASGDTTTLESGLEVASSGPMSQRVTLIFSDDTIQSYSLKALGRLRQELSAIPKTLWLKPDEPVIKLELMLADTKGGSGESQPPAIIEPAGVALDLDQWITLEIGRKGGRPTRQLASMTVDFSDYDGPLPTDLILETTSGARCTIPCRRSERWAGKR